MDALTKVLVGLYEESDKPANAVDYVKRFMGAPTGVDIEALRAENEDLKKRNTELLKTIEELNKRVRAMRAMDRLEVLGVSVLWADVLLSCDRAAYDGGRGRGGIKKNRMVSAFCIHDSLSLSLSALRSQSLGSCRPHSHVRS